ncbi:MAG: T9SS type A sorting domain-containing protein [Ignavibacteria bacterium]|nr:T9SS type A sorting domain-containing protein [Ignavibacteria bacterium]
MNNRFAVLANATKVGMTLLIVALFGIGSQVSVAQKPEMPILTLTGSGSGWNSSYYPDGRIWVPRRGTNGERTMLVPVFIKNCWRSTETYKTFPIYSFKFKIQYDSTAFEFTGVDKNGPNRGPLNMPIGCLAKDFEFTSNVARDLTYQSVIAAPIQNRQRGKRVLISGISSRELPQTGDPTLPCDQRPYVELVYLRFRVIANPAADPVSARTPLIISNDTLFYNDFQMTKSLPFPGDPFPGTFAGLGGVDNYYFDANLAEQIRDPLRPSRPGMIWVEVTDLIPKLSFTNVADPQFRLTDSVSNTNGANWFIVDPITIDSGSTYDDNVNGVGTRDIDVINSVTGSRAYDVTVQSDADWLLFKSFLKGGVGEINPFPQPVREGYIPLLDKGILGTTLGITPQGDATIQQRDLNMRIICDPNKLPLGQPGAGELAGIYVGNLTFKSANIDITPVQIKVTFIYFRPPFEPNIFDENDNWKAERGGAKTDAMRLEVRNSNNPQQRTYLVFGVGARARDTVDTLFGETVYRGPLSGFGARWYPKNKEGNDMFMYGLGDLWAATPTRPKAASRDIRDIYSDTTISYVVRFDAGSPLNYPVVVAWDTDDFTPGAELFIRDTLNGSRFNVNMRNATSIGGSRYSFTIRDADVNAFVIEYTLPKVVQFPVISKGWNLLSLPVNPSSNYWQDVFKQALNVPIKFAQNIYEEEDNLSPGVGFFVKYSDDLDKSVAGSRLTKINDEAFPTRMYDGWNTIGSLSTAISTETVDLLPYGGGGNFPTIEGDIYRYVTNRGYQAVSAIEPGLGYWMKIRGQAYLKMQAKGILKSGVSFASVRENMRSNSTVVVVSDASSKSADLYIAEDSKMEAANVFELPPVPPHNLFDVRFSNESYVEDAANPLIRLQGVEFPITINVNNPTHSYTVVNPVSGQVLGNIVAGRNNHILVTDSRTSAVKLLGEEVNLKLLDVSVSPNPIAVSGFVTLSVPQSGHVTVELFDAVGVRVNTLLSEYRASGVYSLDLNTASVANGRYMIRVSSNGNVVTNAVTVAR